MRDLRRRQWLLRRLLLIFYYLFSKDGTAVDRGRLHKGLEVELSLADGLQDNAAPLILMVLRSHPAFQLFEHEQTALVKLTLLL